MWQAEDECVTGIIVCVSERVQRMYFTSTRAMPGGGWKNLSLRLKAVR